VANRLIAKTVNDIQIPGRIESHQIPIGKYWWPSLIISPQDDSGGWMPSPRKLSIASANIIRANSRFAKVISGFNKFGSKCRNIIRESLEPTTLADSI
jgi:hypothetical protein